MCCSEDNRRKTRITAWWLWASTRKINKVTKTQGTRCGDALDSEARIRQNLQRVTLPRLRVEQPTVFTVTSEPQKQPNWMLTSRMS